MVALTSIHLNPAARVYTLRLLLVSTIPMIFIFAITSSLFLGIPIFIWVHHILAIFQWTMPGLAALDLAIVVVEIGGFAFVSFTAFPYGVPYGIPYGIPYDIPALFSLLLCLLFRIATIVKTEEKFFTQRLSFLGCCAPASPPYTSASILLNRSLARPLVRGEAKYIIIARALVLTCIGIGLPAFGIYVTVIKPANATVFTAWIPQPAWVAELPGNASISFEPDNSNYSHPWNASVTALKDDFENIHCPSPSPSWDGGPLTSTCPCSWDDIRTISFSAAVPSEAGFLHVWITCDSGECDDNSLDVPLLPGSHLFAMLGWSQRQTISQSMAGSYLVFRPEIYGLQQDTSAEGTITSLTLTVVGIKRFFQDTADASAFSGIATFGGFWTFVNGTFALFFGANIVYFAFGRRPLSALGVVHLFQRRALVRKWSEDFPAIHTEGGLPGSQNAGVVAFIRERLVDLGADPREIEQRPREPSRVSRFQPKVGKLRRQLPWKKKAQRFNSRVQNAQATSQNSDNSETTHRVASSTRQKSPLFAAPHDFTVNGHENPCARSQREYILAEIPLLDIDLSPGDVSV
ncbi:Short-chain dehydrogenase/reductase family protein [Mycena sanguinolenta]|uniref:Short-chain dehydrogenase/reductase family protein n=1 Tax=Mycena sanguinolenta TaxID=230812 RepID=A0A8H6YYA0_9AGAR|nr:Short-chain dehydrogenase/reductase family protein [Mycena sanguinolenta]